MFFEFFGLVELLVKVVNEFGYMLLILIQQQVILVVFGGGDLFVGVQIGIGKIVGFMLLIL